MKHRRLTHWMELSSQEDGRLTNYGAVRVSYNWYGMCTPRERSLPLFVMAGGCLFPRELSRDVRLLAQAVLKMILPMRVVSGSTKLHSAREIWCGVVSSRIFRLSAGN